MASGTISSSAAGTRVQGVFSNVAPGSLALAAAIPILFLHVRYQPGFDVGSATVAVRLSDLAVGVVICVAVVEGWRQGFAPLRAGRWLWAIAGAYFVWVLVEVLVPLGSTGYAGGRHGVSAAKFFEYALLAPAVPLILRRRTDLQLVVGVVVGWSGVATVVGLVQFFGANIFVSGATGGRQLSFLGFHDFGAVSAAALVLGVATIALPSLQLGRQLGWSAAIAGTFGLILSASLAAVVGVCGAAVALVAVAISRHEIRVARLLAAGCVLAVAVAGSIAMRGSDLGHYLRFLGLEQQRAKGEEVESYAHRTVLAWIGWEIFRDHPVAGVGWQASSEPSRFMAYVVPARVRFPNEPPLAFPAPNRRYGVQNFYVQTLADLGAVGLGLIGAVLAGAASLAIRALRRAAAWAVIALAWTLVVSGGWIAQGIVAGLPLDALTWLAVGLAVAGAARAARA